jgi:hypothetical protein
MSRIARGALAGLVAIAAVLGLIHVWPDESPLPETQVYRDLLAPASTPKSWFYGALGFFSDGDIFASGERFAAAFRQSATVSPERHPLSGQAMREHYLALYAATDFAHVMPPGLDSPMPDLKGVLAAQLLVHADLLGEADMGRALERADRDLAYWRRVLAGTNTFLSKMVAVRGASRALMLRGKLIERLDLRALGSLPTVPALSPSEWSMRDAIRFEMGTDYLVIQDLEAFIARSPGHDPGIHALLPMKPNATFNRHQQNHAPILALTTLPAADLASAHAGLPAKLHAVNWWDHLFNGKGVWILRNADATDLFGQYVFAVHDLDAQIALINLKHQLLSAGPGGTPFQQQVALSPIRNPYQAEEAGRWNEPSSELVFDTRPGPSGSARLPLRVSLHLPALQ